MYSHIRESQWWKSLTILVLLLCASLCESWVSSASSQHKMSGVRGLLSRWVDITVSLPLPVPDSDAYSLYSQLTLHPTWSPWLKSVEHNKETGISNWVLNSRGVTVSWKANNTVEEAPSLIKWESLTGLPNKGKVVFTGFDNARCNMTLTLSYDLPAAIATVVDKVGFVEHFIEETMLSDLRRFRDVLAKKARMQKIQGALSKE